MRACIDCGAPIGKGAKRCKSCAQKDNISRLGADHFTSSLKRSIVHVDVAKLRRTLPQPYSVFEIDAGLGDNTVNNVLRRGRCYYDTLDRMAVAMGCHCSEFEVRA